MTELVIRNIGQIVSGAIGNPVLDGDTILVRDGRIDQITSSGDIGGDAREIDACGATVFPGLIDSHTHPVFGDFTPRQHALSFIEGYLHGGVTSMISAGEVHLPGRPRDPAGVKALAILAAKSWKALRPAGVKVHGGAVLLERGLTEADFAELAGQGVELVGEIGVSGVHDPDEAESMARWARNAGMRVIVHAGGASIPGSSAINADFVLKVRPDVAGHVNGGPTAVPVSDVERIVRESDIAIEVVQCGNVRALRDTVSLARDHDALDRIIVGTDSPSGTGVIPLGILRTISWIASLGGIDPAVAVAMATGSTARVFGLPEGIIAPGAAADLLIVDCPMGSEASDALGALSIGDTPAVAVALIDGQVRVYGSRNTPPPVRKVSIPWMTKGGH